MVERHVEERYIEPINILIVFLLGLAAALFVLGSIKSFEIDGGLRIALILVTCVVYGIVLVAFLRAKKIRTPIEVDPEIIEREVERIVDRPVDRVVVKYRDNPSKIVEKHVVHPVIVEKEKEEKPKSKYVGSSYNERYHLRNCRFAGVIKKQYLVEENDRKYFKLRGYESCKVCEPDKN